MDKFASISDTKGEIARLLLSASGQLNDIYHSVENFIGDPTVESAQSMDDNFSDLISKLQLVKDAIYKLSQVIIEAEDQDIVMEKDDDGFRLV